MSRPKTAEKSGITIHLSAQELAELDADRAAAIASVPGARLTRTGWAEQRVREALAQRNAQAQQEPAAKTAPKKSRAA